jgi:hypothetical protein
MGTEKVAKVATKIKLQLQDDNRSENNPAICGNLLRVSHVGDFGDQKVAKVAKKFECKNCDYNTSRKSNRKPSA